MHPRIPMVQYVAGLAYTCELDSAVIYGSAVTNTVKWTVAVGASIKNTALCVGKRMKPLVGCCRIKRMHEATPMPGIPRVLHEHICLIVISHAGLALRSLAMAPRLELQVNTVAD